MFDNGPNWNEMQKLTQPNQFLSHQCLPKNDAILVVSDTPDHPEL